MLFAIVEGDYTRFHGVTVNVVSTTLGKELETEFCNFVYDEVGEFKINFSKEKSIIENKNWDKVVVVT